MIYELRVTDKEGMPVSLAAGTTVGITVHGSESYEGRVVNSDQGGVTHIDFDDESTLHIGPSVTPAVRAEHLETRK
jgi:hypothetical protein